MTRAVSAADLSVRRAIPSDARSLSELAERAFRAAFSGQNSAADMDLHCQRYFNPEQQLREIADPARDTLLAEISGELGGYTQLRPNATDACPSKRQIEIQRFYLLPAHHGVGIAQALMASAIEAASERDADTLWLGTWEHNPRALAFYSRQGFAIIGEQTFPLGNDPQRDIVLARTLGSSE